MNLDKQKEYYEIKVKSCIKNYVKLRFSLVILCSSYLFYIQPKHFGLRERLNCRLRPILLLTRGHDWKYGGKKIHFHQRKIIKEDSSKGDRNRLRLNKEPTRWGAQHRHGVWYSAAGIWRNLAAFPVASHWWGCDPCLSRSPQQRAPHVYVIALWRPAIEARRESDGQRDRINSTGREHWVWIWIRVLSEEDRREDAAHWEKGGTGEC